MKKLNKIMLILTEDCNMRCTYCFEAKQCYKKNYMSKDILNKSLDLLFKNNKDNSDVTIELFGGEPSLNINAAQWISNYLDNIAPKIPYEIYLNVTTNLLNPIEFLDILFNITKKHQNVYLDISGSGVLLEKLHNQSRITANGNGTYKYFLKNLIEIINKYPTADISVHTVLTPNDLKLFTALCDNILKIKEDNNIEFANTITLVNVNTSPGLDTYTKEDLRFIYEDYITRPKEERVKLGLDVYSAIPTSIFNFKTDELSVCRVFKTELSIMPNGDILPCHKGLVEIQYNNLVLGNISSISNINDIIIPDKYLENIEDGKTNLKSELYPNDECNRCSFNNICHKCVIDMINATDTVYTIPKEECAIAMTKAELTLEYERVQAIKEQNELLKQILSKIDLLGNITVNVADGMNIILSDISNKTNK